MRVFNLDQLKHVFRSYVIILCCKRGGKYGFHRKTRLFAFFIIHLSGGAKTGSKVCTTEYSIIYNPIFDSLNAENSLIMRAPGIFCCLKMLYGRVSYNNFLIFLLRSFGR